MNKMTRMGAGIADSFRGFANSNFVAKLIVTCIIWLVALVPTWISLGLYNLVDPVDFWQRFATVAACVFVLGGPQVILAFIGFAATISIVFES